MLNKYKFIKIMEEIFAKLSYVKYVYQIKLLFLWNKISINSPLDWLWSIYNLQMLFNFHPMKWSHYTILDVFCRLTFISGKLTKRGVIIVNI